MLLCASGRVSNSMSTATVPALREELRLLPAASNKDGSPAWMIQDPVINRFYRIGWLDFELLVRWGEGIAEHILQGVNRDTTLYAEEEDLVGLIQFLQQHNLIRANSSAAVEQLHQRARQQEKNHFQWFLQNYLFFRLPLIKPQVWLQSTLPYVDWLYSKTTALLVFLTGLLGVFLVSRQWDSFIATLINQLGFESFLGFALALVVAKTVHELGHAYTSTRYGARVAHMGVAMVVMFPMLYTDTSESWKLSNAKQRMAIASAGIVAELGLAAISTLAWCLCPDGALREALLYLATTSWVLTLGINASPFLRFDGYFILADYLDMPNLHERSGATARVWMRRTLFGFTDVWPESEPANTRKWLILFALVTWIYRFFVYLGIALLVYILFFKLLGAALFFIEMYVFIGKPVWSELSHWWQRRGEITMKKKKLWLTFVILILAVTLIPWRSNIVATGWVHSERQQIVFSPLAGRLQTLPVDTDVKQDQTLFVLASPDLEMSEKKAASMANYTRREIDGLIGIPNGSQQRPGLISRYERYTAEERMYKDEQARLVITAPFDGRLYDLDTLLAEGVWVKSRQPLAMLVDDSAWVVDAYLNGTEVSRVSIGAKARLKIKQSKPYFIDGEVVSVDASPLPSLPHPMLDAATGGPIVTAVHGDSKLEPKEVLFKVRIHLMEKPRSSQMALADVQIHGEARAWLPEKLTRVAAVIIMESGF